MGLDIDRLVGYGDDFGMNYPKRMFKVEFEKLRKRGKPIKHPHKAFRSAFKNAMNKNPPYIRDWDEEEDLDWFYNEGEEGTYDLPDYSYADYKPTFGLKDQLGNLDGEEAEQSDDIARTDQAWRNYKALETAPRREPEEPRNEGNTHVNSKLDESWFPSFFRNIF